MDQVRGYRARTPDHYTGGRMQAFGYYGFLAAIPISAARLALTAPAPASEPNVTNPDFPKPPALSANVEF